MAEAAVEEGRRDDADQPAGGSGPNPILRDGDEVADEKNHPNNPNKA